jgi:hypothetical protein
MPSPFIKQASGMMQTPDLQGQQLALQRQQAIVDALKQQGAAPFGDTQVVSGRAIPITGLQAVSKLAQQLGGAYSQKKLDEKQVELTRQQQERFAKALRGIAPAGTFQDGAEAAPQSMPQMPQSNAAEMPQAMANQGEMQGAQTSAVMEAPPMPEQGGNQSLVNALRNSQQRDAAPAPMQNQTPDIIKEQYRRAIEIYPVNPELAQKMLENVSALTNEQKNMAFMGQDPRLMGSLGVAKARKESILELQPGTTSRDMMSGEERFQPKVGEGIMLNNGNAGAIPGYANANAQIAGAAAAAQAGGQAGYRLETITGPDGQPRMVTAAQAAGMAGGQQQPPMQPQGPANQGFPAGTQLPAPTPGANSNPRLDILNQERQSIMSRPDSDPRKAGDLAAINREIQGAGGARPVAPSMPGIPLQSEAQKVLQTGAAQNQVELDKNLRINAQSPESQQKIVDAQSVLGLVTAAEPLLNTATGSMVGAGRDYLMSAVGADTDASKAAAQLAVIGGQLVSKMPKMSGPQSDKDVQLYREMAGKIGDPTATSGNKAAALKTIKALNEKYISQNQGSMPAAAARAVQGSGGKVTVDDLLKKYGGK